MLRYLPLQFQRGQQCENQLRCDAPGDCGQLGLRHQGRFVMRVAGRRRHDNPRTCTVLPDRETNTFCQVSPPGSVLLIFFSKISFQIRSTKCYGSIAPIFPLCNLLFCTNFPRESSFDIMCVTIVSQNKDLCYSTACLIYPH